MPFFKGKPAQRRDALFLHYSSNRALITGKWKLVSAFNRPWELYRLDLDRTEVNDLASQLPDKVSELDAAYRQWWRDVGQKPFTLKPGQEGVPPYRGVFEEKKFPKKTGRTKKRKR